MTTGDNTTAGMHRERVALLAAGPASSVGARVNWRAFWVEAKRLGFYQRLVHALAGARSIADLDPDTVKELLERMRERAEEVSATPAARGQHEPE